MLTLDATVVAAAAAFAGASALWMLLLVSCPLLQQLCQLPEVCP
jgi:hypothetical protein